MIFNKSLTSIKLLFFVKSYIFNMQRGVGYIRSY
nr:MAG TPA: hypothetical protein [Caudoviricetes sp.]